jgi:RNA polymerase sigma-70 factor (ECF subfamily)
MAETLLKNEPLTGGETANLPQEIAGDDEDERLLAGLLEGQECAYEALIQRFQQPVYNLVGRLLKDPTEACDVVQEVFLKVFRKVGSFRGASSLRTWIYRIAVNEAHNYCRWYGRHRRQEVGLDGSEEGRCYRNTLSCGERSPFDCTLDRENHALIEESLASLTPAYRDAVVLRDVEDLSYEEISDVLRLPLGTVKSRILRGREALRKELERRMVLEPAFRWTPQVVE